MTDMVTISPEELERLRDSLPAITDRYLFDVLGISETTWNKLRRGLPVKRVTLDRALAKQERWQASSGAQRQPRRSRSEHLPNPSGHPLEGCAEEGPGLFAGPE
jgi:hypothetical protein